MSQWYAIRTATRREKAVEASLGELAKQLAGEGRGLSVYLPMATTWKVLRGKALREAVQRPLIPGYLFVLCQEDVIADLHEVEGVHAFVTYMGADEVARPIPFPVEVVVGLQADECAGVFDYTRQRRPEYRPKKGDRIKVVAGSQYFGFIGRVLDTPRGERVNVMMEGKFGRGATVQVANIQAA